MLDRHPVGRVAAHLTASARPPEAEIVDHSMDVECRRFRLRLVPGSRVVQGDGRSPGGCRDGPGACGPELGGGGICQLGP